MFSGISVELHRDSAPVFLSERARFAGEKERVCAQRINSANVPVDFNATDPATDPAILERARQLSDELQSFPQQRDASASVAEKLEAEFGQQVQYSCDLGKKYGEAQKLMAKLRKERDAFSASTRVETG